MICKIEGHKEGCKGYYDSNCDLYNKSSELTTEEKERRGRLVVEILGLKKDKDFPGRYFTTWGNKTVLGIYETTLRIIKEGV